MAELRAVPGLGVIANYECLGMHGYIVEDEISTSSDRLIFWPKVSEKGFNLEEKIGFFGSFIVRLLLQIPGIKGLCVSAHEIMVLRERDVQWENLEDKIVATIKKSFSEFECLINELRNEISQDDFLSPLDECHLEFLDEYHRR
jgi:hypothetical protein